jgi:hypothetical protein
MNQALHAHMNNKRKRKKKKREKEGYSLWIMKHFKNTSAKQKPPKP